MSDKCRKCGFDNHIEDAEFCQKCGTSIINYCTNKRCDLNNGDAFPVPYDADYCPTCGALATLSDATEEPE